MRFACAAALGIAFALAAACSTQAPGPVLRGIIATRQLDVDVHVAGIAVAEDGDLWLATINYGDGPAGALLVRRGGTSERFSSSSTFNRVAIDAHGVAWFTAGVGTAHEQPSLTRVDASGRIHAYPLPPEGDYEGIVIGSDGEPWFTDAASGIIGRLTSSGSFSYYGPTSADPTEMIEGPDGDLWFTEPDADRIGRLHADGTIDEFRVPTARAHPTGITAGTDGAVWFCESAADKIGRIGVDGHVTEHRLPKTGVWPLGIAAARDGSLWFTELTAARVGRIARNGAFEEFAVPGGGYPGPIASAADGTMWLASNAKRDAGLGLTSSRSFLVHFKPAP
ncbi:MAG TPA: hypothetical protein VEJ20_04645 [Candidatus Eremiobacteraceae bacterium]|nr:hypothetical protein [Candidatus Eremiobacteraceae bacterium]